MSHICNLCGRSYKRLSKLFEHLRNKHDVDILDINVKDYVESNVLSGDEIQEAWEKYWMGQG